MRRCLIVDDSHIVRRVARKLLEDLGLQVIEAQTGEAALAVCRDEMPEIVIVDWLLPGEDSFELLAAIRASAGGYRALLVYLATENERAAILRAKAAGADEVLLKPFDRASLVLLLGETRSAA